MGQIKHKMGNVGGGVDISHKSKMSGKAKSLMSFPGGMPGPGNYGSSDNKIVGRGMAKYLAGESVGMRKMDPMHNGKAGVQQEDFEQFSAPDSTGPAKKEDRIDRRKKRQEKRAEKRVNRGEKRSDKLQKRIDKTTDTVLKAKREARKTKRDGKVTMNKKAVSKDFVSDRDKKAKEAKAKKEKSIKNTKVPKSLDVKLDDNIKKKFKGGKLDISKSSDLGQGPSKYDDGPMKTDLKKPKKEKAGFNFSPPDKKKNKKDLIPGKGKQKDSYRKDHASKIYDVDQDGDSITNDYNQDGTMLGRALKKAKSYVSGGAKKTDHVVVKGDKSKVNNKITKTNTKAKKIALLKEQKAIKSAQAKEKIKEKRNMIQVKRDLEKNKRNQKIRKRDGKDYQANTGTDNQKTVRRS